MYATNSRLGLALLFALSLAPVLNTGCAVRVSSGYRVYDPYHSDYHTWNDGETVYYNQWVVENHREHRDFRKLRKEDQKRYWNWRHDHPDHR
jgi:hypothetical protein